MIKHICVLCVSFHSVVRSIINAFVDMMYIYVCDVFLLECGIYVHGFYKGNFQVYCDRSNLNALSDIPVNKIIYIYLITPLCILKFCQSKNVLVFYPSKMNFTHPGLV